MGLMNRLAVLRVLGPKRRKRRKQRKGPVPVTEKTVRQVQGASYHRHGLSLWVDQNGPKGRGPQWTFSDRATGRRVLYYWPTRDEWQAVDGERGCCRGPWQALALAAARRPVQ
jgi:hypothetical protein